MDLFAIFVIFLVCCSARQTKRASHGPNTINEAMALLAGPRVDWLFALVKEQNEAAKAAIYRNME